MIPAETRHVTIEGTTVMVAPASVEEARAALRELKHKRKELIWLRRSCQRDKKAAELRRARTERPRRAKKGFIASMRSVVDTLTVLPRLVSRASASADLGKIDRDLATIEETLHNLDSAIIQVQGKLLHE